MQKHLFAYAKTRPKIIRKIIGVLKKYYRKRMGSANHWNNPFHVLVSCVLSQRTREENTEKAAHQLFSKAATPEAILKMSLKKLQALIKPAGFYKQKAKRIKEICRIIIEKYDRKVPQSRSELMELPGVGFKTADVVLAYGFGLPAIPVDTHVNRVSKRLGLVDIGADVEEVREQLEKTFPKQFWRYVNLGFVNFGRKVCKPVRPKCISDRKNCPFSPFCRAYRTKRFYIPPV